MNHENRNFSLEVVSKLAKSARFDLKVQSKRG